MNLSKKSKIFLVFLIVSILLGIVVFKDAMQPPAKIETKEVAFSGTSDDFLLKVKEDATVWQDKVVVIDGLITSKDEKGIMVSNQIYCQFREDVDFTSLNNNDSIQLKGRVIGYDDLLEELKLDQCIIQK
ncbi:MAG: hypothetical protein ACPGTO_04705 [Polaribacter sp.]